MVYFWAIANIGTDPFQKNFTSIILLQIQIDQYTEEDEKKLDQEIQSACQEIKMVRLPITNFNYLND